MSSEFIPCHIRQLSAGQWLRAAREAIRANPANRAPVERLSRLEAGFVVEPEHIAMLTTRFWGSKGVKLSVAFLDTQDASLKARILGHMNAWSEYANVQFLEAGAGSAEVRIARVPNDGYWSFLGVDVLQIPRNEPTMNLDSFSMQTPESEYRRVVRHETGHTLGFVHEHLRRELVQRLDVQKTLAYFESTQGWSEEEVRAQVLTPIEEVTLTATPHADQVSIMCYQLPGSITTDGQPIPGGLDIDPSDGAFAGKLYPRQTDPPAPPPTSSRLFSLNFTHVVPKNDPVWFRAPVAIPKGRVDVVRSGTASAEGAHSPEVEP